MNTFVWLLLLVLKTSTKGRASFLLFCCSFSVISLFQTSLSLNIYMILYIFVGDVLVVLLITCMSSPMKSYVFSFWEVFFILSIFFFLSPLFLYSASYSLLFSFFWLLVSLVVMTMSIFFFSKSTPKTQSRTL